MCIYLLCLYQMHQTRKQQCFGRLQVFSIQAPCFCTKRKSILLSNDQDILILCIHHQSLDLLFFSGWYLIKQRGYMCIYVSLTPHFDNFQCLSIFIGTTNTTQERDTDKKDGDTITRYIHYIKILVILVGTVLSLTLLLLIGREIFKLFRMSETSGNSHAAMDTPVVNNSFGDITESLYYSIGTQD